MKKQILMWSVIAMLAVPAFVLAQHQTPTPVPAVPGAPAVADEDGESIDDVIAFLMGDDEMAAMHDGEDGDDDGKGGERRIVERHVIKGDGDHGGMAMMHGMGGPGMHGGRKGGHGMQRMIMARLAKLDMTDAQRDKMREIHEGMARKNIQRQADTKLAMLDLHKAMSAENPSSATVNAQIDKVAKLRADGMKAHFEAMLAAKSVLTPEQWKKVHSPGPMGGPGGHGGPGGMKHGMGHGGN